MIRLSIIILCIVALIVPSAADARRFQYSNVTLTHKVWRLQETDHRLWHELRLYNAQAVRNQRQVSDLQNRVIYLEGAVIALQDRVSELERLALENAS